MISRCTPYSFLAACCLFVAFACSGPAQNDGTIPSTNSSDATNKSSDWTFEIIDSDGDPGYFANLLLDSSDNPFVAYFNNTSPKEIRVSNLDNGSWFVSDVSTTSTFFSLGFAMPFGNPAVTFFDSAGVDLNHAPLDPVTGIYGLLAIDSVPFGDVGFSPSLAFDSVSGVARTSYQKCLDLHNCFDQFSNDVRWLQTACSTDGTTWVNQTVEGSADGFINAGYQSQIAFNPNNQARIAYYQRWDKEIKLARQTDTGCSASNVWDLVKIEIVGVKDAFPSIAIEPSTGEIAVAYYDDDEQDLKVAISQDDGVTWTVDFVDRTKDGQYNDIAYSPSGNLAVAYFDDEDDNVMFAVLQDGAWQISVVDDSEAVGQYVSLVFHADNRPRLAYRDILAGNLKTALMKEPLL